MLILPELFNKQAFLEADITYKWDNTIYLYFARQVENIQLLEQFSRLSNKALIGFRGALSEWFFWRTLKQIQNMPLDTKPFYNALDALWLDAINPAYTLPFNLEQEYKGFNKFENQAQQVVFAGFYLVVLKLSVHHKNYLNNELAQYQDLEKLAMLIRHISPDKKQFENWLTDCLMRATDLFPSEYEYQGNTDYIELPVPREFFFQPNFDYEKTDISELLNHFLQNIDYKNNPYLKSPEIMLADGFDGIPYHYQGK